jgi:hypothetical protein
MACSASAVPARAFSAPDPGSPLSRRGGALAAVVDDHDTFVRLPYGAAEDVVRRFDAALLRPLPRVRGALPLRAGPPNS